MNLGTLLIELALPFKPFCLCCQSSSAGRRGCLYLLAICEAFCGCYLCEGRIRFARRLCFPDTNPPSHELGAIRFADQFPLQKEVDDRQIAPVVVDVNFFPAQPIEQSRTHIPSPQEQQAPVRM
jgi:hypothetical protein